MHQLQKILFVSAFIFFTGCSQQPSNSQEIVFPTPNISDIVETKIAEALAKIPTPTPVPIPTPIPTPIPVSYTHLTLPTKA